MERSRVVERLRGRLPAAFHSWPSLAQDQYLEMKTLLAGYLLLGAKGDRMLMANSVEGRLPSLDVNVVALANQLPPRLKLRGLMEKAVLKQAAAGIVPPGVHGRSKQPYRAPDADAFSGSDAPAWVADTMSDAAGVRFKDVFDSRVVAGTGRSAGRSTARDGPRMLTTWPSSEYSPPRSCSTGWHSCQPRSKRSSSRPTLTLFRVTDSPALTIRHRPCQPPGAVINVRDRVRATSSRCSTSRTRRH